MLVGVDAIVRLGNLMLATKSLLSNSKLFRLWVSVCLIWPAAFVQAQWQVEEDVKQESPAPTESADAQQRALQEFEAAKCSNGGTETRYFMDFSTQVPVEQAYVNELAKVFSGTMQLYSLAPDLSATDARSVRFLFELDKQGAVKTLTVFAAENAQPLRDFVTVLVTQSAPFPSFESVVEPCFESVVVSAIFDF